MRWSWGIRLAKQGSCLAFEGLHFCETFCGISILLFLRHSKSNCISYQVYLKWAKRPLLSVSRSFASTSSWQVNNEVLLRAGSVRDSWQGSSGASSHMVLMTGPNLACSLLAHPSHPSKKIQSFISSLSLLASIYFCTYPGNLPSNFPEAWIVID